MTTPEKITTRYAYDLPLGKGPRWDTLTEALEHAEANTGYELYRLYVNEAGRVVHHELVEVPE